MVIEVANKSVSHEETRACSRCKRDKTLQITWQWYSKTCSSRALMGMSWWCKSSRVRKQEERKRRCPTNWEGIRQSWLLIVNIWRRSSRRCKLTYNNTNPWAMNNNSITTKISSKFNLVTWLPLWRISVCQLPLRKWKAWNGPVVLEKSCNPQIRKKSRVSKPQQQNQIAHTIRMVT